MKTIINYYYRFGHKAQWALGFVLAGLMNFTVLSFAYAAGDIPAPQVTNITNGSTLVANVLCPIINAFFWILIGISILMILWAAYLYITAQEDSEKVSRATKTITYAAVGIAVALISQAVPPLVGSILGSNGYINGCSFGGGYTAPVTGYYGGSNIGVNTGVGVGVQ